MIQFKGGGMRILTDLKAAGYSTYRIRKEKLFGESTLQMLRDDQLPSWAVMDQLCKLLGCDVGDLVEYVKNPAGDPEQCRHI